MDTESVRTEPRRRALGLSLWAGALAGLWAVLNPGDHKSWIIGAPLAAAAAVAAAHLQCPVPRRFSLAGALRFTAFFVQYSFKGGWDVARRAFSPAMPLNPVLLAYPSRLRDERAQVLLVNVISLLPGTVSAGLENGVVTLHALDGGPGTIEETRALEDRIAELFCLRLDVERNPAHE